MAYTVKSGDTLWSIAENILGDGLRWKEIWLANKEAIVAKQPKQGRYRYKLGSPHWIFIGTKLNMPSM